jgi:hypothetical protein
VGQFLVIVDTSSESLALGRQTTPLIIIELQSSPTMQLLKDANLFLEKLDPLAMFLIQPTRDRQKHHPNGRHHHVSPVFQNRLM